MTPLASLTSAEHGIAHSITNLRLSLQSKHAKTRTITLNIGGAVLDGTTLTLPPQSFAVLQ